ncbi:MAG: hypothetical protein E7275_00385 [Pseudobutyrivibrio sp.]|uniref:hypothetical protein n=1 Tax=Pseudobutyrivibrio sp. TaxID=2014367 RepID=UPI0025CE9956|nr:hypothetical protein [Pseudobutyrivibrio sp.]MBE5902716.1 hypothetical protein [Pseudobutyrivibrio sp.]
MPHNQVNDINYPHTNYKDSVSHEKLNKLDLELRKNEKIIQKNQENIQKNNSLIGSYQQELFQLNQQIGNHQQELFQLDQQIGNHQQELFQLDQQMSNAKKNNMELYFDNIRRTHDLISPAIKKNENPFAKFNTPRLTTEPLSPILQEEPIPARRKAQQERSSKNKQGKTPFPYADERNSEIDSYRNNRLSKVADREKQDKLRTPYTKLRTAEAQDRRKAQITEYNARVIKENLNNLNNLYNDFKEKVTQSITFTKKSKTTNQNKGKNPTTGVNNKEYNEFKKDILSKDEYNTPLQSSPILGEQQNHYDRIDEKKDKRLVRGNPQSSTTSSPEIKNTRSPRLK